MIILLIFHLKIPANKIFTFQFYVGQNKTHRQSGDRQTHHNMLGVNSAAFTSAAQVKIGAADAFVAESLDRLHLAVVTLHSQMDTPLGCRRLGLWWLRSRFLKNQEQLDSVEVGPHGLDSPLDLLVA